ncbi:unnamed protein product [Heterobilharzia americana]|nr:unnamed protein product [Heterobilharzia americana]
MFLPLYLIVVNLISSKTFEFSSSLSVYNGESWINTRSKIVYLGQPLKLRCTTTASDNITISRKDYDRNVTTELVTKFGTELRWEVSETEFSESGVYECVSRGLLDVVTVYIYSILDQRIFGQYRCIFSFSKSEHAVATVHLKVPPILRLVYDPPPIPPLNSPGNYTCLTNDTCKTPIYEDDSKVNWTNACEILIAYPLVKSGNLMWAWTQPQWAAYIIRRVEEVGKANVLSDFSVLLNNDDEMHSYGPWQVLERRRRRSNDVDIDFEKPDLVKSGPILFWCWAKNDIGETTTWWPGPVEDYGYSIWSSVWWPLLGVTLELASLAVVFAFFDIVVDKE